MSVMNSQRLLASVIVLALLILACNGKNSASQDWQPGALYSTSDGDGKFGVVKILVLERDAVHVRVYKQKFPSRPASVDPRSLTLAGINDKDGFGIGHLPVSRATFASWEPVFLSQQSVSSEELDGYKMWKEGSGKTF